MIYQIIIEKVFLLITSCEPREWSLIIIWKKKKICHFIYLGTNLFSLKPKLILTQIQFPPLRIFPVSHHLELETPKSIKDSINLSCLATLALPRSRSPPTAPPTLVDIRHILSPATARRRDVESRLTVTRVDMTPARDWPRRGVGSALQFATPSEPFRPCGSFPHFTTTGHLAEPCCRFIARYVTYDAEVFDENMEF